MYCSCLWVINGGCSTWNIAFYFMKKLLNDSDLGIPLEGRSNRAMIRLVKSFIGVDALNVLYGATEGEGLDFVRSCLDRLKISVGWSAGSLDKIPETGAFVVLANLPHGALDGLAMLLLVLQKRPDAKLIGNFPLAFIPELREQILSVDDFESTRQINLAGVRQARQHLDAGHPLILFPAQRLTTFKTGLSGESPRTDWNPASLKFLLCSDVPILPVHIDGKNSIGFRLLGRINYKMQLLRAGRELLSQEGREVVLEVGNPIGSRSRALLVAPEKLEAYLRANITLLGQRARINNRAVLLGDRDRVDVSIDQLDSRSFAGKLSEQNLLFVHQDWEVYCVDDSAVEAVAPEVVAEKSAPATHYIVVVDRQTGDPVGLAEIRYGDQAMLAHGIDGLYTHRYFEYSHKYFDVIRSSIELGERYAKSGVRQNKLLSELFWRAAVVLLSRNAQYRYLLGTSGISANYSNLAKLLIASYIHTHHTDNKRFAFMAVARHSAKRYHRPLFEGGMIEQLKEIDLANKLIADSDPHYNQMPVTLEYLLRQGARVLTLSINHRDRGKLNALMLVDMEELRGGDVSRGTIGVENWI